MGGEELPIADFGIADWGRCCRTKGVAAPHDFLFKLAIKKSAMGNFLEGQVFAGEELGQGVGNGCRNVGDGPGKSNNLVHGEHLKQKSPPVGGRAVDDRFG